MKKNIRIMSLLTVFLILSIGINVFTKKENSTNHVLTFFTSGYTNMRTVGIIDNYLFSSNIITAKVEKSEDADIKLKYSSMISADERKNYDIYELSEDRLIIATAGDNLNKVQNLETILKLESKNVDNNLVAASPCAYNWLLDHNYINKGEMYVYKNLPELILEDKKAVGVAFETEVGNLKQCHFTVLLSNHANKETLSDYLYLMIKKDKIDQRVSKGLISELKKGIQ